MVFTIIKLDYFGGQTKDKLIIDSSRIVLDNSGINVFFGSKNRYS